MIDPQLYDTARAIHLLFAFCVACSVYSLMLCISWDKGQTTSRVYYLSAFLLALGAAFFTHWTLDCVVGVA